MLLNHWTRITVVAILFCLSGVATHATDFRIVSKVYVADAEEPASTNVTLFRAGLVYDFLQDPDSTTIFDALRGRFVLIDPAHDLQTEMKIPEVAKFNEELKARLKVLTLEQPNPLLQFMAEPKFEIANPKASELILTSPHMTYHLHAIRVKDTATLREYYDFSNWYARLNTMVNPGSTPPFARIALNRALSERNMIPTEVNLSIVAAGKGPNQNREVKLRSTHEVTWKLLAEDLRRIDEAGKRLATFKSVAFEVFYRAGVPKNGDTKTATAAPPKSAVTRKK